MGWARNIVNPKIGSQALLIALLTMPTLMILVRLKGADPFDKNSSNPFHGETQWKWEKRYMIFMFLAILFLSVVTQQGFAEGECETDTTKLQAVIAMACFPIVPYLWMFMNHGFGDKDGTYRMGGLGFGQIVCYYLIMIPLIIAFWAQDFNECEDVQAHAVESFIHARTMAPMSLTTGYVFFGLLILTFVMVGRSVFVGDTTREETFFRYAKYSTIATTLAYVVFAAMIGLTVADLNQERKECADERPTTALIVACLPIPVTLVVLFLRGLAGGFNTSDPDEQDGYLMWGGAALGITTLGCMGYAIYLMNGVVTEPKKCDQVDAAGALSS